MNIKYPVADPHTFSADEVLLALDTDATTGITQSEAEKRTKAFGLNAYKAQKQKSILMMMLRQFNSPIVYLLFFAVAVTFYIHDYIESIAILVVIVVNALIGFFMELQALISMNALKEMDVSLSKVVRDGAVREIPSENIVPGDLVMLEAGDLVPGDGHVTTSNQLQCDESSLTGESLPVDKHTAPLAREVSLGDRFNMVYKGTSVTNGNGQVVITGIGEHTQLGTITTLVGSAEDKQTPLDKKISLLTKKLIWITLAMIAIFATTGFIQGKNWVVILETSIALTVAAFPEGLPIVATVALAYGMLLMARRNAIVKKLSAVETLGSANVILTDKTGTLTENKIYVDTLCFYNEKSRIEIKDNQLNFTEGNLDHTQAEFQELVLIGALCNNASHPKDGETGEWTGDPIEIALMQLAGTSGHAPEALTDQNERIGEIPFSSETKVMATLHQHAAGKLVAAKGSVEHLLENCTRYLLGTTLHDLTEADKTDILTKSEKMASEGLRVLAFAYKEGPEIAPDDYLNSLIYVAMIGFLDPPRLDIKGAITTCRNAGIKIVMITGDHPLTALNIAKKVGLVDENEEKTISGMDLPEGESVSEEWTKKILDTAVFARTTPKQKLDIVSVYQKAGNIVAMTGDGVNDAPALKKADIGIAMGLRGTQVAKETASMVLKDDSFVSITLAVAHGREIFQNIQKFVIYLVSCNLSEIFAVTALGFIAPAANLLALQILFLNMVTDVFPALALGLGEGDKTVMDRPPRDPKLPIVSNRDWVAISIYALIMTLSVVAATMYCTAFLSGDPAIANNVAFLVLTFSQLFHVFNMASVGSGFWVNAITTNKFVWLALLLCIALIAAVYLIAPMRLVLGLKILPPEIWLLSVGAGLVPLIGVQLYKLVAKNFLPPPILPILQ